MSGEFAKAEKPPSVTPEITGYKRTLFRGIGKKPVDEGMYGKGTYFSSSKEYASQFGEVQTKEITLVKPFTPKSVGEIDNIGNPIFQEARRKGASYAEALEARSTGIREILEKQGYDGIVLPTTESGYQEVVVFHPEKSVAIPKPSVQPVVQEAGKSNPGSNRVLIDCSCAAFGPLEMEFTLEEAKSIGDSIGVNWDKIDPEQFRQGLAVELEHGCRTPETNLTCDKPDLTGKIALAHLHEDSEYYSKLKKSGL